MTRFQAWEAEPPAEFFGDPLWRLAAFRYSRFLAEVVEGDIDAAPGGPTAAYATAQLLRSVTSISANIAEGYSRTSGRDRARFFEIALGSAREAREWYRRLRGVLGEHALLERAMMLTRIIKILSVAIPQERAGACERRIAAKRRLPVPSPVPAPAPTPAPAPSPAPDTHP